MKQVLIGMALLATANISVASTPSTPSTPSVQMVTIAAQNICYMATLQKSWLRNGPRILALTPSVECDKTKPALVLTLMSTHKSKTDPSLCYYVVKEEIGAKRTSVFVEDITVSGPCKRQP